MGVRGIHGDVPPWLRGKRENLLVEGIPAERVREVSKLTLGEKGRACATFGDHPVNSILRRFADMLLVCSIFPAYFHTGPSTI